MSIATLDATIADEPPSLDATGLAQAIRDGDLSPLEALEGAVARAEALQPTLNFMTERLYDRARERAKRIDLSTPFAGVPYLLKDETDLVGVGRRFGSRLDPLLPIASTSDPMAAALETAGVNIFGRTTMSEFGALPTTETLAHGATRNPWNPALTPGGSSGGAAAAVASGVVSMADAWDGAGSIRIPAANCGLVGLKPDRGRVAAAGEAWFPRLKLAHHLCVSRSVRDTANVLALVERRDPDAPYAALGSVSDPSSRRLRIGLLTESLSGPSPSPEVVAALESAVRLLTDLGHEVVEARWPFDAGAFMSDFSLIYAGYAARMKTRLQAENALEAAVLAEKVEPASLAIAAIGEMVTDEALETVLARVSSSAEAYFSIFRTVDLLLSPVLLGPPVPIGHITGSLSLSDLTERLGRSAGYTMIQNASGGPAISLPLHWTDDGLPIGLQFAAGRGDERTLLELAYELEQARPWFDRRPPIWGPYVVAGSALAQPSYA